MKLTHTIVGVRELRRRLSAYLCAVAQGRTITIGESGGDTDADFTIR